MQPVTNTNALADLAATMNQKKADTKTEIGKVEDRFLKLLVTQMKNQDPLNPLDNAQVTTQMAQINTVNGIEKLNSAIQALSSNFAATQSLQATSMIGHGILAPGAQLELTADGALGGVNLAEAADKVMVKISNAAGKVIHSVDLGALKAGSTAFSWDGAIDDGGTATPGKYKFEVEAKREDTKVTAEALQFGQVGSVSLNSQGVSLNVTGFDTVSLSDVKQVM